MLWKLELEQSVHAQIHLMVATTLDKTSSLDDEIVESSFSEGD